MIKGPADPELTAGGCQVFKILWSEPRGGSGGRDGVSSEEISHEEYESMGRKFYTGYRRFVIVANDYGHCTCV